MPFTFSHPAIVLPFRKWLFLSGLIIGSITPDFEYFIRMKSKYSHTFCGAFWFDLPLALIIGFLFFNLVCKDFIENLPVFLKSRLIVINEINWNSLFKEHWLLMIISITVGIFSHILWDSFTHLNGIFVQKYPYIFKKTFYIAGYKLPVYRIFQHLSTLIGGIVIIIFIKGLPRKKVLPGTAFFPYWISVAVLTAVGYYLFFYINNLVPAIWNIVIVSIASFIASLIVISAVKRLFHTVFM